MRQAYEDWAAANRERSLGVKHFNKRLEAKGCVRTTKKVAGRPQKTWIGISLLASVADGRAIAEDQLADEPPAKDELAFLLDDLADLADLPDP